MRDCSVRRWLGVFVAGLITVLPALGAGKSFDPEGADANWRRVTVTVHTRQPGPVPVLTAQDVKVYENNRSLPVKSWIAAKAQTAPLDLTIVLDGSIRSTVSLQFGDLAAFLPSLPSGTRVRVAYAEYGGNRIAQDFTADYPSAARALRIPLGPTMAGASIYQSVAELLKHWPNDGNRRALLLISDGTDFNQGYVESDPMLNTELQRAIDLAQSGDVPVYTLFARGAFSLERNWYLFDNGQSCLLRLSRETGGQSYFMGTITPLSFAPYLRQLSDDLRHEYVLTFLASSRPQSGYQRIRVTTEVPGISLSAPARVYVPKAG